MSEIRVTEEDITINDTVNDTEVSVLMLKGEKGDKGDTGATGAANTLTIGTVTGGSSAAATITGTAPNQTLNLTLPKGDKGDTGNTGANGQDGADGYSPTVTTSKSGKVTTITITDKNGDHVATINDGADGQGSGDMLTSVYDTDGNGIVDNAEKVNNHTVATDVPSGAVFTDTQSNWNETSSSSKAYIQNKPTIPTVNNATLTIQKNGTSVATFTANASSNATANITVPTATSGLTNDSNFISLTMSTTDIGEGQTLAANTLYGVYE